MIVSCGFVQSDRDLRICLMDTVFKYTYDVVGTLSYVSCFHIVEFAVEKQLLSGLKAVWVDE